jgi:predicted phosphodiesterase
MTRLAVLADIHSNLPALEAVLADMEPFEVDRIIVAGDIVNWGAFSAQVMDCLAALNCAFIRGNNELYLTDMGTSRAPAHWQRFTVPPFTIKQLGSRWINVIATWPDSLSLRFPDAPAIRVVHGSPRSAFEGIFPEVSESEFETMMQGVEETTMIAAHTHLLVDRQIGRWHLLNPGSVGNPLDGKLSASYLILDGAQNGWRGTHRRVAFDVDRVFQEFERTRFIEHCGVIGQLVVEEYRSARVEVYPFLVWLNATHPGEPESMELLDAYRKVNKLDYTPLHYKI